MSDDDLTELGNRACGSDSPALRTHPGDEALHVALVFHGSVMNGGLLDAVQTYGEDQEYPLLRVRQACTDLNLDETAHAIDRAQREVTALTETDLERAARVCVDRSPDAFAPLP